MRTRPAASIPPSINNRNDWKGLTLIVLILGRFGETADETGDHCSLQLSEIIVDEIGTCPFIWGLSLWSTRRRGVNLNYPRRLRVIFSVWNCDDVDLDMDYSSMSCDSSMVIYSKR